MKEKEESLFPFSIKAGEYHTMFRTGLKWIIPFTLSAVFSSMMGKYRYIAFLTVTASVWSLLLRNLSKRMVEIKFTDDSIIIDNTIFPMKEVENYYTCLPLRKAFMLRLQTKDGKRYIYYIPVECRNKVEDTWQRKRFYPNRNLITFFVIHIMFLSFSVQF
ncbi:hypothetical protein [Porphyromonas macacae]|uniref:hypothetical protein n=1 Tax=Porphyromonas macacae TaxID=28115 RepID=UPI0004696A98|nr:hypothetical protein [Porphyromonas macacae]